MVVEEDGSALVEETVTWLLKDPLDMLLGV